MSPDRPDRISPPAETLGDERLDSWKEIAAYLKRDVRTLHRWEAQEGLPIRRHLHRERGSVYAYKSELDSWWDNRRAVLERPASAVEVKGRTGALKLAVALAGLAVLLAGAVYLAAPRIWPHEPSRRMMLAVLPFENLGERAEENYFSDGLTDELITQLGALEPHHLGVIARTSAMQYKRGGKSASQVGHELGVDYILEGTIRREGKLLRVAVKLVKVTDQTNLWTESYERNIGSIFSNSAQTSPGLNENLRLYG